MGQYTKIFKIKSNLKTMNKQKLRFILPILFILSLNLTTSLVQVKAATQTIEIKATKDAYVSQDYPISA